MSDGDAVDFVVEEEDKQSSGAVQGLNDRLSQVKLNVCVYQSLENHYQIAIKQQPKVVLVREVDLDAIVARNAKVYNDRHQSSHHVCLERTQLLLIWVQKSKRIHDRCHNC